MSALTDRLLHHGVSETIEALVSVQETLRSLPARHPARAVTDPEVRTVQEQITPVCDIIDNAVAALRTGRDPAGNSLARAQVGAGLQHLVDDCRGEQFTAVMLVGLDADGGSEFQRLVDELGRLAARLRRS